jgi:RNA polymerase sigma-70 factor (ECF subfamily)
MGTLLCDLFDLLSRSSGERRRLLMGTPATFEALRPHLLGVAYRMLGSVADAEDAVQDAWLRFHGVDEGAIQAPKAWLSTTLGRICLDRLTSAHARRNTYVGPWLPEPVSTTEPLDTESISMAFLLLLERLSPLERVAFVLHQVFDHSHAEIAEALGSTDVAVRQAFHRAKQHIASDRPRFAVDAAAHERLLRAFFSAVLGGDLARVTALLVEDAVLSADGGGKVRGAAQKPLHGASTIARFFVGIAAKYLSRECAYDVRSINGWPAVVVRTGTGVGLVLNIETDGEHIFAIRNVLNPDKLRLTPLD